MEPKLEWIKVLPQLINAFTTSCFIKLLSFLTMLAAGKTQTSIFFLFSTALHISSLLTYFSLIWNNLWFQRLTCLLWTSHWHSMAFTPATGKRAGRLGPPSNMTVLSMKPSQSTILVWITDNKKCDSLKLAF